MKKTLLLLIVLAATAYGQTAPSGYTTNYRIRQWASGANPGADSLNANWSLIDSTIRRPRYTYQDSLIIGATSSPSSLKLYVAGAANITGNTTVGGTFTGDTLHGSLVATGPLSVGGTYTGDTLLLGNSNGTGKVRFHDASQDNYYTTLTASEGTGGNLTVTIPPKTGTLLVGAADTAAFSGTSTRLAVYISGASSTNIYAVTPRTLAGLGAESLPSSNDVLMAAAKTDSLIVLRLASGTSGLKIQYIRVK